MTRLLQPLWLLLASATDRELARVVEYLKAENRILRSKLPKRITGTPRERNRLVKLGTKLGSAIRDLVTIVTPAPSPGGSPGTTRSPRPRSVANRLPRRRGSRVPTN
ncbi:MAG TPA: hypothetical protein VKE74_10550 [Gemmataceae bacterium]|nr:hypothetical protein [Gemmataceae bacterium]